MRHFRLRTLAVVVRRIDEHLSVFSVALRDVSLAAGGVFLWKVAQAAPVNVGQRRSAGLFKHGEHRAQAIVGERIARCSRASAVAGSTERRTGLSDVGINPHRNCCPAARERPRTSGTGKPASKGLTWFKPARLKHEIGLHGGIAGGLHHLDGVRSIGEVLVVPYRVSSAHREHDGADRGAGRSVYFESQGYAFDPRATHLELVAGPAGNAAGSIDAGTGDYSAGCRAQRVDGRRVSARGHDKTAGQQGEQDPLSNTSSQRSADFWTRIRLGHTNIPPIRYLRILTV